MLEVQIIPITITIEDATIVRGMDLPEFSATVEGLDDGETIEILYSTDGDNLVAGEYAITMMNAEDYEVYEITVIDGTLTVLEGYTVTFDGEDAVTDIPYGDTVDAPEDPTKDGYTFIGWYLDDEAFDFETEITSNLELTSVWEEVEETVETDDVVDTGDNTPYTLWITLLLASTVGAVGMTLYSKKKNYK